MPPSPCIGGSVVSTGKQLLGVRDRHRQIGALQHFAELPDQRRPGRRVEACQVGECQLQCGFVAQGIQRNVRSVHPALVGQLLPIDQLATVDDVSQGVHQVSRFSRRSGAGLLLGFASGKVAKTAAEVVVHFVYR